MVFRVEQNEIEGRYAVLNNDILQGETILTSRPYGIALGVKSRKDACHACFSYSINSPLSSGCSHCNAISYCSNNCHQTHLKFHCTYECRYLSEIQKLNSQLWKKSSEILKLKLSKNLDVAKRQKWKELVDVYDVFDIQDMARWVLNILVRRKVDLDFTSNVLEDGIETHKLIESIPSWADVKKLVSNVETLPLDEKIQLEFLWEVMNNLSTFSRNANISDSFSSYFKQYFPDSIDFISLMSIRTMNGFGLWDSASECLGHGLYPSASYFNHSCRPNMVRDTGMRAVEHIDRTFHASLIDMGSPLTKSEIISALALQPSVVFTALETMPKNTRLHHSYITLTQKRSARIEELKSGYHFECNCERCGSEWTEEKETEFLETFICKGCSQALIPLEICTRCPNILEVSLLL